MKNFFETLYGKKPGNHYILLWELAGKKSNWFLDIDSAMQYAQKNNKDIYVGCGTSLQDMGQHKRQVAEQIAGIGGVWLDIDLKGRGHKKENLPETEADIDAIMNVFPLKPTIIVDSGHGRQCWWVFKDFWSFDMSSDHDNEQAARLMHCFTAFFRDEAFKLGFSVDMTHDLSRVFRFPNCWNAKEVPHVETRMLECNTLRYEPADIVSAIPKEVIERTREERKTVKKYTETSKALIGDEFTINQDADPPWDKLSVLCINDPTFQATWNYNRKDLKDSSPSGYDMALASIASRNGWAKQEMCDMLIAFRKKHNLPSKVHRLDYYQTTLNKAYVEGQQSLAKELMRDAIVGSVALESMPEPDRKKKLLEALSTSLNVKILKILKYRVDPPEYRIETTTGGVDLGTVKGLTSQTSLRNAIADATGYWFPLMKNKDWDNVVQIMLNLCQDEDVGEESTDKGRVRQWLAGYLMEKQRQISTFDTDTAASQGIPYIAHGKLFLFGPSLRDWLMIMHKETVSMKDMGKKLRLYGCSPEKINFKLDGQVYGRSAWSLPVTDSLVSRLNGGGSSSSSTSNNRHEEEKSTTYIASNAEPAMLQ